MKHVVTMFVAFCFMNSFYAQTVKVIDAATDETLPFVLVYVKGDLEIGKQTDKGGIVNIDQFPEEDSIIFKGMGYVSVKRTKKQIQQDNNTVRLKRVNLTFDMVVISGSKWKQESDEVASKVTSISRKDVALQNPQTAADLLAVSGEVFMQKSQQGGGSPMIRGFATNRLLYSIDGIRMNTAIFRSGNIQNVISLDPFAIESTEILFGPGSVIYGSDAIGGVMSFQTLTPKFSRTDTTLVLGNVLSRYSSANNEKTGHFDITLGGKKFSSVTSVSYNDYGHLKMGSNGPEEYLRPYYVVNTDTGDQVLYNSDSRLQVPTGYEQYNLMQKVAYAPSDQFMIEYAFHYSETSPYGRYDRHLRDKGGLPRYGEWSYGPQRWMMNNLAFSLKKRNKLYDQLALKFAYQNFEESRISRDFQKTVREVRKENVTAFSTNADFIKKMNEKQHLFYGLEYVMNDVLSSGTDMNISTGFESPAAARYPKALWSSIGAYITDQFELTKKLNLNTGLRYNQFLLNAEFDTSLFALPFDRAELNNGALTGSVGLVFSPNRKLRLSTNASSGFRAPNVDDVGKIFDSEPGAVVIPNPNLKAEYVYNVDIGIAKIFGDLLKLDISAYYTYLSNALVRRDYQLNGVDSIVYAGELSQVQAIQNAAKAQVYGIQGGIEMKFKGGFGFRSQMNYQVGEEELNDGTISPSRHSAPTFGVSRLYFKRRDVLVELNSTYSAERSFDQMPEEEKGKTEIYAKDSNGNPYSPSWYTINFKSSYALKVGATLAFGLENITDQRYRPYSSGLVAPGRNMVLSISYRY